MGSVVSSSCLMACGWWLVKALSNLHNEQCQDTCMTAEALARNTEVASCGTINVELANMLNAEEFVCPDLTFATCHVKDPPDDQFNSLPKLRSKEQLRQAFLSIRGPRKPLPWVLLGMRIDMQAGGGEDHSQHSRGVPKHWGSSANGTTISLQ
eukprot:1125669-Amphidinium_carterae.2